MAPGRVLAVSPDGSRVCIWQATEHNLLLSFAEALVHTALHPPRDTLFVLDTSTGDVLFSYALETRYYFATFFPDNNRLLVGARHKGESQLLSIDINPGQVESQPEESPFDYVAISNDTLFVYDWENQEFVWRRYPGFQRLKRVPATDELPDSQIGWTSVSQPAGTIIYTVSQPTKTFLGDDTRHLTAMVCRRISDFALLWRRNFLEEGVMPNGIREFAVSPGNEYVAVRPIGELKLNIFDPVHVQVLEGPVGGLLPHPGSLSTVALESPPMENT